MFRYTKLGKSVPGLPYGRTLSGDNYLSVFDRFGPWLEDSEQHFFTGETYEEVAQLVTDTYQTLGKTDRIPSFTLVEDEVLQSADHKYVFNLKDEFFHLILNMVSVMLTTYERDPEARFVIITNNNREVGYVCSPEQRIKNLEFLARICELNDIPIHFLDSEYEDGELQTYPVYPSKNITIVDDFSTILQLSLADINSVLKKYVLEKIELPPKSEKKLYISRSTDISADSAFVIPGDTTSGYTNNGTRLFSEPLLEKYLIFQGFEIVRIEQIPSIEDQIKLMNSASVLLGVTGTGLINSLFLKEGSMIIELKVEILWPSGDHDANDHYFKFSYGMSHYYVAMDVSDKQSTTAISKLETLFKVVDLDKLK